MNARRYYKVYGETKAKCEEVLDDYNRMIDAVHSWAMSHGGKGYWREGSRVSGITIDATKKKPEGWLINKQYHSPDTAYLKPDKRTKVGKRLETEISGLPNPFRSNLVGEAFGVGAFVISTQASKCICWLHMERCEGEIILSVPIANDSFGDEGVTKFKPDHAEEITYGEYMIMTGQS